MTNTAMAVPENHFVNGNPLQGPFDDSLQQAVFALGCFWGAERRFWETAGVFSTAAGYMGGNIENPDYRSVCSGRTGHAEVVLIIFDPQQVSYLDLLKIFWENHDPTQGDRQGNDVGSQYRSAIFTTSDTQFEEAKASLAAYQADLTTAGLAEITTMIEPSDTFYYAEEYHQQYLAKNPGGYCALRGTGISCATA